MRERLWALLTTLSRPAQDGACCGGCCGCVRACVRACVCVLLEQMCASACVRACAQMCMCASVCGNGCVRAASGRVPSSRAPAPRLFVPPSIHPSLPLSPTPSLFPSPSPCPTLPLLPLPRFLSIPQAEYLPLLESIKLMPLSLSRSLPPSLPCLHFSLHPLNPKP